MRILELTNYSAGICGVWNRVFEESKRLAENHEVSVFSSYFTKGSDKIAPRSEEKDGVKILRFPAKRLGGESFMRWDFEKEALKFKPDVIITHTYRHLHSTRALKAAKKLGCKIFLVTHAPFVERDVTRSWIAKWAVRFYDRFIGPSTINKYDKVIVITNWEIPILKKLGLQEERIVYIPNGIPEEFFKQKKSIEEKNKLLFLGRISPIKFLETLIEAVPLVRKGIKVEIVGPFEEDYKNTLDEMIKERKLENEVKFSGPIFDLNRKISKIDSARIFVLPSKKEGMPQALVEAMAREKIVIAAANPAAKDLVVDGKNGFLYEIGNSQELAEKIDSAMITKNGIGREAKKSVEKFSWAKVVKELERLL